MSTSRLSRWLLWPIWLIVAPGVAAHAAGDGVSTAARPFKLTAGTYRYDGYAGTDVNLRWRKGDTTLWIGGYRDRDFGSQSRAGFDTAIDIAPQISLQPSLQIASRGFVGGSLNLVAGDPWFGIAGIGRTNLKPYFNLNFDPNDALTFGAGHRGTRGEVITLFVVADDRLHTHQKDWHLNARWPVRDLRVTADLLRKSGDSEVGPIRAWGWSLTVDWPAWFLRIARDPKQSFSAQDAWRLSTGVRF